MKKVYRIHFHKIFIKFEHNLMRSWGQFCKRFTSFFNEPRLIFKVVLRVIVTIKKFD